MPANWSSQQTGASPLWITSINAASPQPLGSLPNFSPHTAPNVAFIPDIATVSEASLLTPPVQFNGVGQLRFRHRFNMESTFDGGVLEIKIGAGAFQDILSAGGSFSQGGYTGIISNSFSNPIAGRQAWTGTNAGAPNYLLTVVNLPAAANNQVIQLKWRRGTDSSVGGQGWAVDSIELGQNVTDLQVTIVDSIDPIVGGNQYNYTMTVTNNGPALAENVSAQHVFPSGTSFLAVDSISQGAANSTVFNVVDANFGIIPTGASATMTVKVGAFNKLTAPSVLNILSPASIARSYTVRRLQFGSDVATGTATGSLALVLDGVGDVNDACEAIQSVVNGKIAIFSFSGLCDIAEAVARLQGAGAIGAIAISPDAGIFGTNGGNFPVTIPAVLISDFDGDRILAVLGGNPVSGSIDNLPGQILSTAIVRTTTTENTLENNIGQQLTNFLDDTDLDTVPDVQDNCDTVGNLDQVDTDADGIGDSCDFCTDTDRDGAGNPEFILNTCPLDACVNDPGKKFPGVCGCGKADTDSDGDSTPDCTDACPFDGTTTVGVDANKNGILDCQKTQELKFRLNLLQTSVGKLSANFVGTSKAAKKQKKLRKDIGSLLKQVQSFASGGGINATQNVQTLSSAAVASVKKATKAKGKALGKAKQSASTSLANFIAALLQ